MTRRYIYLHESGHISQTHLPPTEADLICIEQGTLTVLVAVGATTVTDHLGNVWECSTREMDGGFEYTL